MQPTEKSRYPKAKELERLDKMLDGDGLEQSRPVCFHAHGFKVGHYKGKPNERVIRFLVHAGRFVDVALTPDMAVKLGRDLLTEGGEL